MKTFTDKSHLAKKCIRELAKEAELLEKKRGLDNKGGQVAMVMLEGS